MVDARRQARDREEDLTPEEELQHRLSQARTGEIPINKVSESIREDLLAVVPHETFMLSKSFYSESFVNYEDLTEHYPEEMVLVFLRQDRVPIHFPTARAFGECPEHHLKELRFVGWKVYESYEEQDSANADLGEVLNNAFGLAHKLDKLDLPELRSSAHFVRDFEGIDGNSRQRIRHLTVHMDPNDSTVDVTRMINCFPSLESLQVPSEFLDSRYIDSIPGTNIKSITFTHIEESNMDPVLSDALLNFAPELIEIVLDGVGLVIVHGSSKLYEKIDPSAAEDIDFHCVIQEEERSTEEQRAILAALEKFKRVKKIILEGFSSITDDDCEKLFKNFSRLRELDLVRAHGIDSGALETLKSLPDLLCLHINDCAGITEEGIQRIGELQNLEVLSLNDIIVTDDDLDHLKKLKNLGELTFVNTPGLTKEGLIDFVRSMPSLYQIVLNFESSKDLTEQDQLEIKEVLGELLEEREVDPEEKRNDISNRLVRE